MSPIIVPRQYFELYSIYIYMLYAYFRVAACSKQHFQPVPGVYLNVHDDKILNDVTLLACKAACVLEDSFSCKSIEYSAQNKTCRLSRENTKSAPSQVKKIFGSRSKYEMYDHLCRTGKHKNS